MIEKLIADSFILNLVTVEVRALVKVNGPDGAIYCR